MLDEVIISKAIIETYFEKLMAATDIDVAIAGAGPAGITAAYYLASEGLDVAIFERKLSPGGGMWGGGMLFNEIVVQADSLPILDEFRIRYRSYDGDYFVADSIESVAKLLSSAMDAGARIFNGISVEDTMIKDDRVCGLVINWSAVEIAGLHVDPLTIRCKYAIEATGHPLEVLRTIEEKKGRFLNTKDGGIQWEEPMDASIGERLVVDNTREIYPGIFVAGMAANAAYGSPRMGPVFGGMLMSGQKAAEKIIQRLREGA